jgi:hypothetical protein
VNKTELKKQLQNMGIEVKDGKVKASAIKAVIVEATETENEIEKHLKKGLFGLFTAKKYLKAIIIGLETSAKGLEKEGKESTKTLEVVSKLKKVLDDIK